MCAFVSNHRGLLEYFTTTNSHKMLSHVGGLSDAPSEFPALPTKN